MRRHVWLLVPAAVALVAAVLGIGVSSLHGAKAGVDEPQYLLTALSLAEDHDLDISDELAAQRWRAFHADQLPVQTEPLAGGARLSPHDPLLPLLLAVPMGVAGWVGAKVALGVLAAACAALLAWTAAARFAVSRGVACVGASLAFASPPLGVYSQQVYPEVPAALATLAAVALLTATRPGRGHAAGVVAAVVVLPWLGAKYVPVAVALAVLLLLRLLRTTREPGARGPSGPHLRAPLAAAGVLAFAGVAYLAVHRAVWGGWTVYATGDHFQQTGEFSVVGVDPSYLGRSLRTVALFVDQHYGLVPWQPAWLLLVPAVVALSVRRPAGWATLLAPLGAAWLTAIWVALTMHGFWWPGRQVVVVLPLAAVAVLWTVDRVLPRLRIPAAALAATGVLSLGVLLVEGWQGSVTWVMHFRQSVAPVHRLLAPVLPDYTGDSFMPGHLVWLALLGGLAAGTWRYLRRESNDIAPSGHQPARRATHDRQDRKVTAS